ncbi:MAG: Gldg family protein [Proteobacteria bacterium]|nr:Gldg family protein [Pseudomonadota bacterium]
MKAIAIDKLSKSYERIRALAKVRFEVEPGEVIGLLGPNGAGKTTLMKILTGYIEPDEGEVRVHGIDVLADPIAAQRRIGYLPESAPLYPEMLVQEYLDMMAAMRGVPESKRRDQVIAAIKKTGLVDRCVQPIGTLSKGYRQRVGIAQAIIHEPDVLILDEPTTGLDPAQIVEIRDLVKELAKKSTVLLSTHILSEVEATCDRVLVIMGGQLRADAKLADLRESNVAVIAIEAGASDVAETLGKVDGVTAVESIGKTDGLEKWRIRAQDPRARLQGPGPAGGGVVIWTVAKKELRGYFNSAIAVIFLAAFLAVTLYTFFGREKFFARGLADLRPLFEWMPKLLIILVSALAMQLWSNERRGGTLEVLLTLPIPRWKLVLGKFVAGMLLIALALALTLELPLTIAKLGHLDKGPVIGGYLAALLLSAAYLSIGMCVSAATDNQIVAFVLTAALCGVAYAIGDLDGGLGRALGTGARFESVARGVLDLRDLAYYGAIVAIGISVNVLLLQRVGWSRGPRTRARRIGAGLAVGLVTANAIALVVWLSPVRRARIDLTTDGTYSLSPSTEKIIAGLDERLLIRAYFSERTHPKLAPLVPQIRDLLDEYRVVGGDKVRVEFVDPTDSDDAKREAKERFAIDPTPLRFATQTEKSVVNAYFAVAIEYGNQHAVLGIDKLIKVHALDVGDVDITLGNLEYELTKTIKKTVAEFSSIDTLFASSPDKVKLTVYLTPKTLPDNWKEAPAKLEKLVATLTKRANGKLEYKQVEPKDEAEMKDLYQRYGLRPYSDILANQVYYFHLLLQVGDRAVRVTPPQQLGDADLENSVIEGLKRAAPGFTRVVGLWSPPAPPGGMPPMEGMPPQQQPPPQAFTALKQELSGNYEVRDVTLGSPIPDEIETLILGGPSGLDAKAAEVVDQFVMRGGALVVLAGRYRLAPARGIAIEKVTTGLEPLFDKWGIKLGDDMVLDEKSDTFPIPENRDVGNGMVVRELHQVPYPFFVKLDGDQLASGNLVTGGLAGAVIHWGAPVKADAKVGDDTHVVENLLVSSEAAWLSSSTDVEPKPKAEKLGFARPTNLTADKSGKQVLAVAITGGFTSGTPKPTKPATGSPPAPAGARLIEHSPPNTRIVVFGSSAFVSDDLLGLAQQLDSDFATSNVQLVHNAVDWSIADTDLLAIRAHNSAARALTVDVDDRTMWRNINIAIAFAGLAFVVVFVRLRRRGIKPYVVADKKGAA